MFEIELNSVSPRKNELRRQEDRYLDVGRPGEQPDESEMRPLVDTPTALVPEQQQLSEGQSVQTNTQVLTVPPAAAIGQSGIVMLSISTVIIFASMAMLAYLWAKQNNASAAGNFWRLIVVGSWLPQVITLCTLAIRWATAVQFCLFTSMLASVAVESFQVTLSQIMAVSVMRATSAEPAELLWALLRGNHYVLWGKRTIALTTALLLLQSSFQLSSTILLSDLHPGQVRGNARPQKVPYGLSPALQSKLNSDSMGSPWTFKPPFWPSFAESARKPIKAEGMIDTGFALRAFLPFETAQGRLPVGNYSGVATVIPSRITCFQPPLSDLTIHIDSGEGEVSAGFVTGKINFEEVRFELLGGCNRRPCREMSESTQSFNCTFNYGDRSELGEWAATLCSVEDSLQKYEFESTTGPYYGNGYLLFNVTGKVDDWYFLIQQNNGSSTNLTLSGDAEWMKIETPSHVGHVSTTLCYYNPGPLNSYEVNMSREAGGAEPRFKWDANRKKYDTLDIRRQLGAQDLTPPLSHQERGILTLAGWRQPVALGSGFRSSVQLMDQSNGSSYTLCQHCVRSDSSASVHRALATLFQDVFMETSNPALALQALFTTVTQMNYYSLLAEFDLARNASVTPFITVSLPQRWNGFGAVAGLVAAHFLCGALVVILFLKECQCSMLGQLWRCIAQIRLGDTDVVLKKASLATDDEIRMWLRAHGKGETRVGVLPWRRRMGTA